VDARAGEHSANRSRLADAERTRALAPLVPALQAARSRHELARADLAAGEVGYPGGAQAADSQVWQLADAHRSAVAELAPVETELAARPDLERAARTLAEAAVVAEEELQRATAAVQAADDEVDRNTALAAEAAVRAGGAQAAASAVAAAQGVARAVLDQDRAAAEVDALQRRLVEDEADRNRAWQAWLELRERRLAGIAAELAGTLTPGDACRVCGSTEHPQPARPGPAPVGADDEHACHATFATTEQVRDATLAALSTAQSQLAAAGAVAGEATAGSAALALAMAQEQLEGTREAAAAVAAAQAALAGHEAHAQERQRQVTAAQEQVTAVQRSLARAVERLEGLRRRTDLARGEDPDLATRRSRLEGLAARAEALLDARRSAATAATALADLERTAREVAHEAGFESLETATAATLDDDARLALGTAVVTHDRQAVETAGRRTTLARPTVLAVLGTADGLNPEDLTAVDAALEAAAAVVLDPGRRAGSAHDLEQAHLQDAAAADRVSICRNAFQQLSDLVERARGHERRAAPLLARFRTLDELTRCVEGIGGDNTRRMTLSAYVLAARLEQVAAAATLRLAQMSSGRYGLEHTDSVDRGRGRSGLALEVVDSWTGSRRDTASLSGGESFYTSLALALGLADVVSAEAGGVSIETLFVDEGFGTLDDDTLEEVMDVLDGLRSGGRSIGIVSHVADLRSRIPAQLEVLKTEEGSTVRLVQTG
jgi:DNA repair protein SbcC/Rad50